MSDIHLYNTGKMWTVDLGTFTFSMPDRVDAAEFAGKNARFQCDNGDASKVYSQNAGGEWIEDLAISEQFGL